MSPPPLWHRFAGSLDDASSATLNLLRALNVAAAPGSVAGYVTNHPAFPSLAAVVDTLAEFGVSASAHRLGPEALADLEAPALLQMGDGNSGEVLWLVENQLEGHCVCRLPNGEVQALPHQELAARFRGIAVSAQAMTGAGERYATRHALGDRLREAHPRVGLALFLAAAVTVGIATSFTPPQHFEAAIGFTLSSFVGLALTLFLALREYLSGTNPLSKLCPTGKTFNCSSVLGSEGGLIAGVIPLADVAVAFFVAQIVALACACLNGLFAAFLTLCLLASAFIVPMVLYSLVLQAFVIRRWCALCVLVDSVLIVQLILAANATPPLNLDWPDSVGVKNATLLAAAAAVGALTYALARPLIGPARAAPRLYAELEQLRGLPEVFGAVLARAPSLSVDVPGKISHGSAESPIELTLVSHPFCVACADAHLSAERLVQAFPHLVRLATVFSVSAPDAAAASAARMLLANPWKLRDWYLSVNENVHDWVRRSGLEQVALEQSNNLQAQREFCEAAFVQATPALLLEGRPLPSGFELRHLRFFLKAEQRRIRAAQPVPRESA